MSRGKPLTPGVKTKNLCLNTTVTGVRHYFPSFTQWLKEMEDPRQPGKIEYPAELMLWMRVVERLAGIKSNNEFESVLRTSTEIEENMFNLPGISGDELPPIEG